MSRPSFKAVCCITVSVLTLLTSVSHAEAGSESVLTLQDDDSVRDAVERLADEAGLVLIYDGRKLTHLTRVDIPAGRTPRQTLEKLLGAYNLRLKPIGIRTFAITEREIIQPVVPEVVPAAYSPSPFIDTIMVTGAAASAQHLANGSTVEIDEKSLRLLNKSNVSEAVFELPQSLASFTSANTTRYGATGGLNLADLRGLGPERTLVQVNGRRRTPLSGGNGTVYAVDLTTLPVEFLERIELLDHAQGVAAGPEGVVGSLNFVTRSDLEGMEYGGTYGLSQRGDAETVRAFIAKGGSWVNDRGHYFVGVEMTSEDGLIGADRKLTADPYGFDDSEGEVKFAPGFGGSILNERGLLSAAVLPDGEVVNLLGYNQTISITPEGELEPLTWQRHQLNNWAATQSRILPNSRVVGVATADLYFDDGPRMFGEAHFGFGRTKAQLSALPVYSGQGDDRKYGDGIRFRLGDPFVPQAFRDELSNFSSDTEIILSRRITEIGPRENAIDRKYLELIAGAEWSLEGGGTINTYLRHGNTQGDYQQFGLASRERLEASIDPALCALTPDCIGSSPFQENGFADAVPYFVSQSTKQQVSVNETELHFEFANRFYLAERSPISLLMGGSLRHEEIKSNGIDRPTEDLLGDFRMAQYDGGMDVSEAYIRSAIPVLAEDSPIGAVEIGGGARFTHSSVSGWAENAEFLLEWSPYDWMKLRARHNYGERPPNLSELFLVSSDNMFFQYDVCSGVQDDSTTLAMNCLFGGELGVPNGFIQPRELSAAPLTGNPDLKPEQAQSFRADLIINPVQALGLEGGDSRFRVSYTDHKLSNAIITSEDPLGDCYSSVALSDAQCGFHHQSGERLIQRDPATGQLLSVATILQNDTRMDWRGIDTELRYVGNSPLLSHQIDQVWFSALHTYTMDVDAGRGGDLVGTALFPEHRVLTAAGVQRGRHEFAVQSQFRSAVQTSTEDVPEARLDAMTTFDAAWRMNMSDNTRFTATLNNVGDQFPDIAAYTGGLNVLAEHYDLVGRKLTLSLEYRH